MKKVQTVIEEFDRQRFAKLQKEYYQAKVKGEDSFILEDKEYNTQLAKYLLEFLAPHFPSAES